MGSCIEGHGEGPADGNRSSRKEARRERFSQNFGAFTLRDLEYICVRYHASSDGRSSRVPS